MDGENPSPRPVKNHPHAVRTVDVAEDKPEPDLPPLEIDDEPSKPSYEPLRPDYHKNSHAKRNLLILFLIAIAFAAAFYFVVLKKDDSKAPTDTSGTNQTKQTAEEPKNTDTEQYGSINFNLSFDHPKDWTVSDVDGSGVLAVTSTPIKFKAADMEPVTGQVLMTMRDKKQELKEFSKGEAIAVIDSEKIDYTKPTETQRGSTYISFLNYASSFADGIDGIYVTGDAGYKIGQLIPSKDIAKMDPIINVSFIECSDDDCSAEGDAVTISAENWKDNSFKDPILNMLKSLAIQ
jgi:hypothetical protein